MTVSYLHACSLPGPSCLRSRQEGGWSWQSSDIPLLRLPYGRVLVKMNEVAEYVNAGSRRGMTLSAAILSNPGWC